MTTPAVVTARCVCCLARGCGCGGTDLQPDVPDRAYHLCTCCLVSCSGCDCIAVEP